MPAIDQDRAAGWYVRLHLAAPGVWDFVAVQTVNGHDRATLPPFPTREAAEAYIYARGDGEKRRAALTAR